jgi:hypothetical protein
VQGVNKVLQTFGGQPRSFRCAFAADNHAIAND